MTTQRKQLPRVLTREEAEAIIGQTNRRYYAPFRNQAIIRLALDTGLRNSEVRHLRDEDVDLDTGRLKVRAEGAKGDWERVLWFPDSTAELLEKWIEFRDEYLDVDSGRLFPTREGTKLAGRYLRAAIKRYAAKAGIPDASDVKFHTLRHTAATWKLSETGNLELVRRMLGHNTSAVTRIYARIVDRDLEHAMKNGGTAEQAESEPSLAELLQSADEDQLRAALLNVVKGS